MGIGGAHVGKMEKQTKAFDQKQLHGGKYKPQPHMIRAQGKHLDMEHSPG